MGFGVWGLGFGVWGLGFGAWGLGLGAWGLGLGAWGLGWGFGVWGLRAVFSVMGTDRSASPLRKHMLHARQSGLPARAAPSMTPDGLGFRV